MPRSVFLFKHGGACHGLYRCAGIIPAKVCNGGKYHGVLTKTGRGSCGSFILNKMLGMTQIDRLCTDLPLYSERFISTARLLENHSLPDYDFNCATQEPFIKATRELLGEHQCYPMLAYGTMQESESFRNACRSCGLPFEEFIINDFLTYKRSIFYHIFVVFLSNLMHKKSPSTDGLFNFCLQNFQIFTEHFLKVDSCNACFLHFQSYSL